MLEIINVSKDFRGVHALKEANATFYDGEIHGLVGENGAGKSTMMKIVGGLFPATSGTIKLDGEEITFHNPHDAYNAGIRIVHQELSLIRSLSIAENIFIHRYEKGRFLKTVDRKQLAVEAVKMLEEWGIEIDANEKVSHISMGIRQLVEIARELSTGGKVIILDEPTSSLTISEIKRLFEIIRKLKTKGYTIIFISHRLDEVTQLVDRITVLRDGETIGTAPTKDMTPDEICNMIAGTDISNLYPKTESEIHDVVLETEGLTGQGFRDISVTVRSGEIVGLVGLVGAGRSEFCRAVFGLDPIEKGAIKIRNKVINMKNARVAVKHKMALLSENREEEGIFPDLSVAINTITLKIKNAVKGIFLRESLMKKVTDNMVDKLNIVSYDPMQQTVSELSGGNQQKVLFGRLLALEPEILILDEPTRGVDIGNKTEIHKIMGDFVKNGGTVLMVSSELDEVFGISDRVYILHEGDMVAEMSRDEYAKEKALRSMMGLTKEAL